MNLGLDGKTTLVIGGGSGLGAAVTRALAGEGARVPVAERDQEAAAETVEAIVAGGGEAFAAPHDLADLASLDGALEAIRNRYDDVEILCNNSGGPPPSPAAGQPVELWRQYLDSMALGIESTPVGEPPYRPDHGTVRDQHAPEAKRASPGRLVTCQ